MSVMSMMIFQSCVRYCWVMRLQVSPIGLAPSSSTVAPAETRISLLPWMQWMLIWMRCAYLGGDLWAELQGWRDFQAYSLLRQGFFFGGEDVKIGFAFGRLWIPKRCDSAVFDQCRSSVLNCLFHQLLHLWSQASFSGWNLWTNRPFYDILTYYMFRCICLCILCIYIYIHLHAYTHHIMYYLHFDKDTTMYVISHISQLDK